MSSFLFNLQFLLILISLQNLRTLMLDNPLPAGRLILSLSLICSYVVPYSTKGSISSTEINLETVIPVIVINAYGD